MKTTFLIAALLLLSAGAFGQCCGSVALPSMGTVWAGPDHSLPATRHGLAPERDLREAGGITMAHGELAAWEVMPPVEEVPLGDAAREYRKEHASAKKALVRWVKVGG